MHLFTTAMGVQVPDVGAARMRELDRIAMEEFGIDLLQMMENARRSLADTVRGLLGGEGGVTEWSARCRDGARPDRSATRAARRPIAEIAVL